MIGDWVSIKGEPHKVSYLAPFDFGDARLAVISNDYDGNPYLDVEPIPLTGEILKANGFQYGSHEYTYWPDEDGAEAPFNILQSNRYGLRIDIRYRVVTLHYVHELQHALRLCGLTEFADNFTIE